jgi:hypothetical protein
MEQAYICSDEIRKNRQERSTFCKVMVQMGHYNIVKYMFTLPQNELTFAPLTAAARKQVILIFCVGWFKSVVTWMPRRLPGPRRMGISTCLNGCTTFRVTTSLDADDLTSHGMTRPTILRLYMGIWIS